jgi:hypothetical protein
MSDEAQAPLLFHQGQPLSQESAAAALAAFDADEGKVKAALGGDIAMQQERRDLWLLARGHQPGGVPVMPSDAAGVEAQMSEREQHLQEARLGVWQKHIPMSEEAVAQVKRGLATQQEVAEAKRELERMKADPEFGRRVLSGDMDAKQRWHVANLKAAMRIAPENYDWAADTVDKFR